MTILAIAAAAYVAVSAILLAVGIWRAPVIEGDE